jgi:hypothetical protein
MCGRVNNTLSLVAMGVAAIHANSGASGSDRGGTGEDCTLGRAAA